MDKGLKIYLGLCFGLTGVSALFLWAEKARFGSHTASMVMGAWLFLPAVSMLLARGLSREGFKNLGLKPNFYRNRKYYLLAGLYPLVCIGFGGTLYFLAFPQMLQVPVEYRQVLSAILFAFVLGPILNLPFALSAELGWRGYLLPKLREKCPTGKAVLLSGGIWGLWQIPAIVLGYHYGVDYFAFPWSGIGIMGLFSVAVGSFLAWLTLSSQSIIPGALAHGGLMGAMGVPIFFCLPGYNPLMGPLVNGLFAGLGLYILGWYFWRKCSAFSS